MGMPIKKCVDLASMAVSQRKTITSITVNKAFLLKEGTPSTLCAQICQKATAAMQKACSSSSGLSRGTYCGNGAGSPEANRVPRNYTLVESTSASGSQKSITMRLSRGHVSFLAAIALETLTNARAGKIPAKLVHDSESPQSTV